MANNKNIFWIIAIIGLVILANNGLKKEGLSSAYAQTQEQCEGVNQERAERYICITENCIQIDQTLMNCYEACGLPIDQFSGLWTTVGSNDYSCDELRNQPASIGCIANCIPNLIDVAPPICEDTAWMPKSTTVCQGESFTQTSNCGRTRTEFGTQDCTIYHPSDLNQNRIVENNELLAYANKWLNNEVTNTDLLNVATLWLAGGY